MSAGQLIFMSLFLSESVELHVKEVGAKRKRKSLIKKTEALQQAALQAPPASPQPPAQVMKEQAKYA